MSSHSVMPASPLCHSASPLCHSCESRNLQISFLSPQFYPCRLSFIFNFCHPPLCHSCESRNLQISFQPHLFYSRSLSWIGNLSLPLFSSSCVPTDVRSRNLQISSNKSRQSGFISEIKSIFHSLFHRFRFFSRFMASSILLKCS